MTLEQRRQKVIAQYEGIVKSLEARGLTGTSRHALALEMLQTLRDDGAWQERTRGPVNP